MAMPSAIEVEKKIGEIPEYQELFAKAYSDSSTKENTNDKGRQDLTKNPTDAFVFKVPSLRNVAMTGPYFHDGKTTTLEEAVKKMAYLQLGKELSESDTKSIATFLKTLTNKN